MPETINKVKEQVVDKYISHFKQQLWWLEKKVFNILPFRKTLKNLLSSDKDISDKQFENLSDLSIWRKILGVKIFEVRVFWNFVDKFMNFAKEKFQEIVNAETQWKLKELRNTLLGIKKSYSKKESSESEWENKQEKNQIWKRKSKKKKVVADIGVWFSGVEWGSWSDIKERLEDKNLTEEEKKVKKWEKKEKAHTEKEQKLKKNMTYWWVTAGAVATLWLYLRQLQARKLAGGLLSVEVRQIEQSEKMIKEMKKSIQAGSLETLGKWKKLGENILSGEEGINLIKIIGKWERKILKSLNEGILKEIASLDDEAEIIKFLKSKFSKSSDEVITTMARVFLKTKNVDQVKDVVQVMRMGKEIQTLARVTRAVFPLLDAVWAGAAVFMYTQESQEADEIRKYNAKRWRNKQQQANFHLALWAADAVASVVAMCSSSGPAGWIALVVWLGGYAVYETVDNLMFNVRDFYFQRKEDYKKQSKYKLRQAILQSTVKLWWQLDPSLNEKFQEAFTFSWNMTNFAQVTGWTFDYLDVPQTLEDAYWAYMYLEEIDKQDYNLVKKYNPEFPKEPNISDEKLKYFNKTYQELVQDTSPEWKEQLKEYQEQREKLQEKIALRMGYIKQYMPTNKNKKEEKQQQFSSAIKSNNGIAFIEKILVNSGVYAKMKMETIGSISGLNDSNEYIKKYWEYLKKQQPIMFKKLENMEKEQPLQFENMYYVMTHNLSNMMMQSKEDDVEQKFSTASEFLTQYYEYRNLGKTSLEKSLHHQSDATILSFWGEKHTEIFEYIVHLWDKTYTQIWAHLFSEDEMKDNIALYTFREEFKEREENITDNVGQNILFDIATRMYGYTWKNDALALISFFSEDKKNEFGIYFDSAWRINDDRWPDARIDLEKIINVKNDEELNALCNTQLFGDLEIDTATETTDDVLTAETKNTLYQIIKENYQYRKQKLEIEKEIVAYVRQYWDTKTWWICLPYHLLYKWQKAGIGSLYKYFFRYDGEEIYAISRWDIVQRGLDFNEISLHYQYTEKSKELLSENQKKKVDLVHQYYEKLAQLVYLKWGFSIASLGLENTFLWTYWSYDNNRHELDIPRELMDVIIQKWNKWQEIETSLEYLPSGAKSILINNNYRGFVQYFDEMYQGILKKISHYSTSNDINSVKDFSSVYWYRTPQFWKYDEKKNKTTIENTVFKPHSQNMKAFYILVKNKKEEGLDDMTLDQYIKNIGDREPSSMESKLIQRYCLVYTKSLLEYQYLQYSEEGNIEGISSRSLRLQMQYKQDKNGNPVFNDQWKVQIESEKIFEQERIDEFIERNLQLEENLYIARVGSDMDDWENGTLDFVYLNPELKAFQNQFNLFEEKIKNTAKDEYNWFMKRGLTSYEVLENQPLKIAIKNWNTQTEVAIDKGVYKVWNFSFDTIQELLYHTTFTNRIQWEYLVQHPNLKGKFQSDGMEIEVDDNKLLVFDTTILTTTAIKQNFPYLKNKQNLEWFIAYLNTL